MNRSGKPVSHTFDDYLFSDYAGREDRMYQNYPSGKFMNKEESSSTPSGTSVSSSFYPRLNSHAPVMSETPNRLMSDSSFSPSVYSSSQQLPFTLSSSSLSSPHNLNPSYSTAPGLSMSSSPQPSYPDTIKGPEKSPKSSSSFRNVDDIKPFVPHPKNGDNREKNEGGRSAARKNRRKGGRVTEPSNELLTVDLSKLDRDNRTTLMIRNIPNGYDTHTMVDVQFPARSIT